MWDWWNWYQVIDKSKEARLVALVNAFPGLYNRTRKMWVKFRLGVERGLFTPSEQRSLIDWFRGVADTWELVRPNWQVRPDGTPASPDKIRFGQQVDSWIESITGHPIVTQTLGLAVTGTVIVVGSVLALGSLGYLYVRLQEAEAGIAQETNKASLIDARTAGQISEREFTVAIQQETGGGGFLGDILGGATNMAKLGLAGVALYFALPLIRKMNAKTAKG